MPAMSWLQIPVDARLAIGCHGLGWARAEEEGLKFTGVAETRPGRAVAQRDGIKQCQRLMNHLAFVRCTTRADMPLNDRFVVVCARLPHGSHLHLLANAANGCGATWMRSENTLLPVLCTRFADDPASRSAFFRLFFGAGSQRHSCFGYWRWSCCLSFG